MIKQGKMITQGSGWSWSGFDKDRNSYQVCDDNKGLLLTYVNLDSKTIEPMLESLSEVPFVFTDFEGSIIKARVVSYFHSSAVNSCNRNEICRFVNMEDLSQETRKRIEDDLFIKKLKK